MADLRVHWKMEAVSGVHISLCPGDGQCLFQGSCSDVYVRLLPCAAECRSQPCAGCGRSVPPWHANMNSGVCLDCAVGSMANLPADAVAANRFKGELFRTFTEMTRRHAREWVRRPGVPGFARRAVQAAACEAAPGRQPWARLFREAVMDVLTTVHATRGHYEHPERTAWRVFALLKDRLYGAGGELRALFHPTYLAGGWWDERQAWSDGDGSEGEEEGGEDAAVRTVELRVGLAPQEFTRECCVCLDTMAGKEVALPECGHVTHVACLATWVGTGKSTCPMCRSDLCGAGGGVVG